MMNCNYRCSCSYNNNYSCNNFVNSNNIPIPNVATPPTSGYINLLNYGGFFAYLSVSYIAGGAKYISDSNVLAVGQQTKITLPQNSTNITATVWAEGFPFVWGDIFVKNYQKPDEICLLAYGITLVAICKEIPCTSPGIINHTINNI